MVGLQPSIGEAQGFPVAQELLLADLEGDRVHNALALHALQALPDRDKLGGVSHEGKLGHVRLRHAHAHEPAHRRLVADEDRAEVEAQDARALLHLLRAHLPRLVPLAGVHQLLGLDGAHE
eukprot:130624-Heterocapsa_arctica.AAC.1